MISEITQINIVKLTITKSSILNLAIVIVKKNIYNQEMKKKTLSEFGKFLL